MHSTSCGVLTLIPISFRSTSKARTAHLPVHYPKPTCMSTTPSSTLPETCEPKMMKENNISLHPMSHAPLQLLMHTTLACLHMIQTPLIILSQASHALVNAPNHFSSLVTSDFQHFAVDAIVVEPKRRCSKQQGRSSYT